MLSFIKRVGRFITSVFDTLNQRWLDHRWVKAVANTPLLNDVTLYYTIADLNEINSARSRCRTLNHVWSLVQYSPTLPPTYVAECLRCYPHKDSRFTLSTDHLFDEG